MTVHDVVVVDRFGDDPLFAPSPSASPAPKSSPSPSSTTTGRYERVREAEFELDSQWATGSSLRTIEVDGQPGAGGPSPEHRWPPPPAGGLRPRSGTPPAGEHHIPVA
ncbi:hypothetical protein [Streptomyces sp. UG1]|uniref:hypothetical protein n=1 Tax=Streptomyces sp. UG1 TaxID=3417652 RepID=UPI003CEEB7C8